jgi:hypothetical protein
VQAKGKVFLPLTRNPKSKTFPGSSGFAEIASIFKETASTTKMGVSLKLFKRKYLLLHDKKKHLTLQFKTLPQKAANQLSFLLARIISFNLTTFLITKNTQGFNFSFDMDCKFSLVLNDQVFIFTCKNIIGFNE